MWVVPPAVSAMKVNERAEDLSLFVEPWCVEEVPLGDTPVSLVQQLERGETVDVQGLDMDAFLGSTHQVMLVVGEDGAGKSSVLWHTVRNVLRAFEEFVDGLTVRFPPVDPPASTVLWVPVVLDLAQFDVHDIRGLLPK
jgi:hypothetical protein